MVGSPVRFYHQGYSYSFDAFSGLEKGPPLGMIQAQEASEHLCQLGTLNKAHIAQPYTWLTILPFNAIMSSHIFLIFHSV